jgi:hypothetical protein
LPPTAVTPPPVRLRLADLPRKPLAGEGNFVWQIPLGDGLAVLKVYQGSRSPLLYLKKSFGNLAMTGRSSHQPRARCATEVASVRLWERHGFRCFRMLPEVEVEGLPRDVYMVFEWTPGRHFRDYFRDESVPVEERLATWRRWVPEWHRRHAAAVANAEPRLIHENGDVKHVMLWQGDFVYFDFEIVFRGRDVRCLVGREIAAYLRSVGRFFGEAMYDRMLDILVEAYPDKTLLLEAWEQAYRNRNPFVRFGRALDRAVNPRTRARWSKYRVSHDLKVRLDRASLTNP